MLKITQFLSLTHRLKDLYSLHEHRNLGPVVPLEDPDPRWVVDGGRGVGAEQGGEAGSEKEMKG